jgi:hypothetical protein
VKRRKQVQDGSQRYSKRQRPCAVEQAVTRTSAGTTARIATCASIDAGPSKPAAIVPRLQPNPAISQSAYFAGLWRATYGIRLIRIPTTVPASSYRFLQPATPSASTNSIQRPPIAESRPRTGTLTKPTDSSSSSQQCGQLSFSDTTKPREPCATTPVPANKPLPSRQLPPTRGSREYDRPACERLVYARVAHSPDSSGRHAGYGSSVHPQVSIGAVNADTDLGA